MATDLNFSMYRGDTKIIDCVLSDELSAPYNLSGAYLWFTAKRTITEADNAAPVYLTLADGITVTNAPAGAFRIEIVPAKTYSLTSGATLLCDMQMSDTSNRVYTIGRGTLTVIEDITRTYT